MEAYRAEIARPLTRAFYNAICEIRGQDGELYGTGMVIDSRRIVTCAHVVAEAVTLDREAEVKPGATLKIRRPYLGESARTVKVESFHHQAANDEMSVPDLAVLRLSRGEFPPPPDGAPMVPDLSSVVSYGETVIAYGFPADKAEIGAGASNEDTEYTVGSLAPIGWYNLSSVHGLGGGGKIRAGYSGGPVWSKASGAVVGITTEANEEAGTAAFIPVSLIRQAARLNVNEVGAPTSAATLPGETRSDPAALSKPHPLRLILDWWAPKLHYWATSRLHLFPDPPERYLLADEMRALAARLRNDVALATYLPTRVLMPGGQLPSGFEPLRQLIRGMSDTYGGGGDALTAEISALSKKSHRVRQIRDLLVRAREPIILLGDPGSGKSLTLQQTALVLAESNAQRVYPDVCLFIRLGKWSVVAEGETPSAQDVQRLVTEQAPLHLQSFVEALARANRLMVMFDGMDEMSRQRYVEHTAALSLYAGQKSGIVRTLFSCRIADFSPSFKHRRLVLLPFDRRHVHTYLHRQFPNGVVVLDDKRLAIADLVHRLMSPSFPVHAANPYMLYLLCHYIESKKTLPNKRIDILDYYFRSALEREWRDEPGVRLDNELIFEQLGEIALQITTRNRGTDILSVDMVRRLGTVGRSATKLARDAGILVESLHEDPAVPSTFRFNSHRAQEFFTAYAISRKKTFNWRGKLDAPRWQETLVNLAQMGGDLGGASELAQVLEGDLQTVATVEGAVQRSLNESDAAERVHLAARVARDLADDSKSKRALVSAIDKAVTTLGNSEDAVTRASVLRVIHQLPSIGENTLIRLLKDSSGWVRDQAQLVAAEIRGRSRTDFDEVAASFAKGDILSRLPTFLGMAKRQQSSKLAALTLVAAVCFALQFLILVAIGPAIGLMLHTIATSPSVMRGSFHISFDGLPDLSRIQRELVTAKIWEGVWGCIRYSAPLTFFMTTIIPVASLIIVFARQLSPAWLIVGGAASVGNILLFATLFGVFGAGSANLGGLVATIFAFAGIGYFAFLASIAVGTVVGMALAVPVWACLGLGGRSSPGGLTIFRRVWENHSGYVVLIIYPIGMGILALIGSVVLKILDTSGLFKLLSHLIQDYVAPILRTLLIDFPFVGNDADRVLSVVFYILLVGVLVAIASAWWQKIPIGGRVLTFLGIVFFGGLVASIFPLANIAIAWIESLIGENNVWKYIAYGALAVIFLGAVVVIVILVVHLVRTAYKVIADRLRGHADPQLWLVDFLASDPAVQPMMIDAISPDRFKLTTEETLGFLHNLYGKVDVQAVQDRIDSKRAELLRLYRHEAHVA